VNTPSSKPSATPHFRSWDLQSQSVVGTSCPDNPPTHILYPGTTLARKITTSPTIPIFAIALVIFAIAGKLSAHEHGELPPLESFFSESNRFAPSLSPCGSKVAFLGPDERIANRLWLVEVDTPESPQAISAADGGATSAFFWLGGSRLLWQEHPPDGQPRLFLRNLKTGVSRQILANEKRTIRIEGVINSSDPILLISLSESRAAFPDLYRVNLKTESPPELVGVNDQQILTWAWDHSGAPVGGLRWTDAGAKELLSLGDNSTKVIFQVDPADDLRLLMTSQDGTRALVLTNHNSDLTRLEWVDLSTGSRQRLAEDPIGRVDLESVLIENGEILATGYSDETMRWHAEESQIAAALATIQNDLHAGKSLNLIGIEESRNRILFSQFSGNDPGTLYLHDIQTRSTRMLWRERPDLDPAELCVNRPIEYPARDGTPIPAYLTIPKGDSHIASLSARGSAWPHSTGSTGPPRRNAP